MTQLQQELTTDLSRGMFEDVAATRYPRNVAAEILNGRIQTDGTVERRDGTQRLHPTALNAATGFGGIEFTTANGVRQLLAFMGSEIHRSEDAGATWLDVTPTTPLGNYYDFATMRVGATNWLFAANGDTELWRWDGTTWTATPNAPAGVKFISVFNQRLWGTGHSGILIQASKIGDPTIWASPDGLTIQAQTHDGDTPTGLFQIGAHLLVFDEHATSYIDGYGEQTLIVASGATGFSRSVGCVAFRTIVAVGDNEVCWLSERGIEYYSPSNGIQLVSRGLQTFLSNIDRGALRDNPGRPSAAYDATEQGQEYHLAVATTGTINNNRTVVLNLLQRGQGWLGAPTIDRQLTTIGGGEVLFTSPGGDYLETGMGGQMAFADSAGYMQLGSIGDPTVPDGAGYLESVTNDALPATLFVAHDPVRGKAVHSVGYDGFVRKHFGVDSDDVLSDDTGGTPVTMTVVSRPHLFQRPTRRKRARIIHLGGINSVESTVTMLVRTRGVAGAERIKTVPATSSNQGRRVKATVHAVGDAPQIEIRTEDKFRLSLLGLSAEIMREEIG